MSIRAYAAKAAHGKIEPFEYEPGPLKPDEVEVKVSHCGICHSDVAMINNDWGWSAYPLVPGHEAVGTVAAVGSAVPTLKVGDRVGVGWTCGSCGHCEWCVSGKQNFCPDEVGTIVRHHGAWGERVRCQYTFAIPIPDTLKFEWAGPLFCAGQTVYTPMLHFGVTGNMRTAVVGIGGLGHLALQYLAAYGCEVTAISSTHSKDNQAKELGASRFIATKGTDELAKAANSFDFILATASAGVDWAGLVNALRPGGELVICGAPEAKIELFAASLIGKEKTVRGGRTGSPSDIAKMVDFSARHGIKPLVELFDMKDVNRALEYMESGKPRFRVVLAA